MRAQYTGLQVCSWLLLLVSAALLSSALFSDYWSTHYPSNTVDRLRVNRGIMRQCYQTRLSRSCQYRLSSVIMSLRQSLFENYQVFHDYSQEYTHTAIQTYELVVIVLVSSSLLVTLSSLLIGPFVCQKSVIISSFFISMGGICTLVASIIYYYANSVGKTFALRATYAGGYHFNALISDRNYISWSYYFAVISGILLIISSFTLCSTANANEELEELFDTTT